MNPDAAGRAGPAAETGAEVEDGAVAAVAVAAHAAGDAGCGILARLLDAGTAASCQE
jgi:hypothetical protein